MRSRAEGLVSRVLAAPETARAVDRALAGALPDVLMRSALEHRVLERMATQALAVVDLDATVAAVVDSDAAQRVVRAVVASPGFDRLRLQVQVHHPVEVRT